jgi:nucleoside-diphosphate-sugar epimerase
MTLLITGATGFLGRRVVVEALRRGHRATCVARSAERADELRGFVPSELRSGMQVAIARLNDSEACRRAVDSCDCVVHLAARLRGSASLLFASTVVTTRTLVDAAAERGVRRFVLVSSIGVYGTTRLRPHSVVDESCGIDSQPHLRDVYIYSKVEQERIAWEAVERRGLPLVVVRPAAVFGPGRPVLSGRVGLRVGPLMIRMGSSRRTPCTYVDNCASAVALACEVRGIEGQAFNIVDDQLPTAREVCRSHARSVERLPAVGVPQWAVPALARVCEWYSKRSKGQLPAVMTTYRSDAMWKPLRYSNDRAKRVLGWRPLVPFAEALDRTVASLQRERTMPRQS